MNHLSDVFSPFEEIMTGRDRSLNKVNQNHSYLQIKVIDPKSNTCSTLAGTGEPGLLDGPCLKAQFNEPGGIDVCEGGRTLVVADTNNHAIRKIDLQRMTVTEVCFQNISRALCNSK